MCLGSALVVSAASPETIAANQSSVAGASRRSPDKETVMAIPDGHRANFNTLLRAAQSGDLALLECADARSGSLVM
jgi:hypothetical protein